MMADLNKGLGKAVELLASAIRDHFPEDSALSDQQLVEKYKMGSQAERLGNYFAEIEASRAELARHLLNITK